MQQSPVTLRQRLIDAVDDGYHVKDMGAIIEILGTLEQLHVTKEMLEATRLGKTINDFRKKTNDTTLAKRAKALVKKWRDAVLVVGSSSSSSSSGRPVNGNSDGVGVPPGSRTGYSSNSSSPQLMPLPNSRVSPNAIHNSNSLSPRILSNLNSNSNNNNLSRNGQSQQVRLSTIPLLSSALSSPGLSASPSLRVSSPSQYGNKTKSPFGPTSSPQTQLHNKTALANSNSYAPNVEVVARTNAANKRLRIEDGSGTNVGPPLKKARNVANGGILEGTLDDPSIVLDELSKDSVTSRASDNSDGSSSKPVSNISSGAVLSAAPSPSSVTLDSAVTSPMSLGEGIAIECSQALIGQDDKTSFSITTEIEVSAVDLGANTNDQPQIVTEVRQPVKRGRKRKQKNVMNAEALLHQQIAQAQQESKIRTVHRLSMEIFDDDHSRPSTADSLGPEILRKPLSQPQPTTALSREDPVMKNEIVEKYLQSQNELRTKMERQYQDAVKRNEIPLLPDDPQPTPTTTTPAGGELDAKKKKKRDKKKNRDLTSLVPPSFPTESEILARLPPIDPQILEALKNFQFYVPSEPEEAKSKPETETEIDTSLISTNETNTENKTAEPPLIASKIDWGDSDDEDDFVDVSLKTEDIIASRNIVDNGSAPPPPPLETSVFDPSPLPPPIDMEVCPQEQQQEENEEEQPPSPTREIQQSDVDRLHLEQLENLNGNLDKDGQFKEWQEVLAVESFKGDLLHILPYTIIDF